MEDRRLGIIYTISSKKQAYVGSTILSFVGRWRGHIRALSKGTHYNNHLQQHWNKYGPIGLIFKVVEINIPQTQLNEREQYWIRHLNASWNDAPSCRDILKHLKEFDKQLIIEDLIKGKTYRQIRDERGVSLGTIGNAKKRFLTGQELNCPNL